MMQTTRSIELQECEKKSHPKASRTEIEIENQATVSHQFRLCNKVYLWPTNTRVYFAVCSSL